MLLISKIQQCSNLSELLKNISVLDAIYWIDRAMKNIPSSCVTKCFIKAGFLYKEDIVEEDESDEFQLDNDLSDLCKEAQAEISASTFISFDNQNYTSGVYKKAIELVQDDEEEKEEKSNESNDIVEDQSKGQKITTFAEALFAVEGLEEFAAEKNNSKLMEAIQDV